MRSPIEALEEWLFKIARSDKFQVFHDEMDEAKRFKKLVEATKCAACDGKLELAKFERGPKGWEADIVCSTCNCKAVISALSTVIQPMDSIGKAREK